MERRGVSPVVATVLLIVIVIVLAIIIFIWARGFLSESAVKGDRSVQISCAGVDFEAQVIAHDTTHCGASNNAAVDINNIGNIPIYGVQVLRYNEGTGNIDPIALTDQPFAGGTVTVGESSYACLGISVQNQDAFRIVPKLLAERDGRTLIYTCPEKDGITIAYVGF